MTPRPRRSLRARPRPHRLQPGDQVTVIAPAGPVPAELLAEGVAVLRSWELRVAIGAHVGDRHPQLDYLAGADADRAADLTDAWCDPASVAVICARGGYGCLRMLDQVDWARLASAPPKIFLGSSDVTALHDQFARHVEVATLFGPMIATPDFLDDSAAQGHLRSALFDQSAGRVVAVGSGPPIVSGSARGVLTGGNLSLVFGVLGAPDPPPPPAGAIVLLEDVTEEPYRLDRMLTQLLRAGWFEGVAGIVLGSWSGCGPLAEVRAMLTDRLAHLGVPVGWEFGFGHCPAQRTIPLGLHAELDADAGTLTLLD